MALILYLKFLLIVFSFKVNFEVNVRKKNQLNFKNRGGVFGQNYLVDLQSTVSS